MLRSYISRNDPERDFIDPKKKILVFRMTEVGRNIGLWSNEVQDPDSGSWTSLDFINSY